MPRLRTLVLLAGVLGIPAALPAQARAKAPPAKTPETVTITSFDQDHTVIGWLEITPFTSKIFHNTRMLRVWLPGNYFAPGNAHRKYPVLYMQDGQNLFDEKTANPPGEWHMDESVDHLIGSFKIPPMIVVGIDYAGEQRNSEYLPYPDTNAREFNVPELTEVHGKEYATFLITEVMPFIEKKYHVATGVANTSIGGSSYGGAVSLSAVLEHPGVFGKALIESPVLGIGDGQLLNDAQKAKLLPQKIFVAIGTSETANPQYNQQLVQNVEELERILRGKGMGPGRLKVVVEEGAVHNEKAWSRRLPDALVFLYGH